MTILYKILEDKLMRRNLGTIDLNTGEILDGVPVYVHAKIKWREGWFMGIQDAFLALAKDKEICGRTRRVLDYMFGKLGFENYICIQQKEICEALDLKKQNVSSAIKLLLKKGIILPGPKLGRTNSYRLNPTYGWKGKVTNLAKTRLELVHSRQD
jgi:hypothetical protein